MNYHSVIIQNGICFGVRRLDAAFLRPGLTGRWRKDSASSRTEEKRRQAAALQK